MNLARLALWLVRLRPARDADAVLFYRLRLDQPATIGVPPASWQAHVDFCCRGLTRGARWYVGTVMCRPVGILRLDRLSDEAGPRTWVSIVVDKRWQSREFGLAMLAQAPGHDDLWARIHEDNAASLRLFARAGYRFGYRLFDSDGPWEIWRLARED